MSFAPPEALETWGLSFHFSKSQIKAKANKLSTTKKRRNKFANTQTYKNFTQLLLLINYDVSFQLITQDLLFHSNGIFETNVAVFLLFAKQSTHVSLLFHACAIEGPALSRLRVGRAVSKCSLIPSLWKSHSSRVQCTIFALSLSRVMLVRTRR